jgi:hypothetical protein
VRESTARSDTAATEHAWSWQDLALEEYRALRDEIVATMQTQDGGLRLGVAAIGVVSAAGFNVWDDTAASASIFLSVVPFVSAVVLTVWMGEVSRMMRAGRHIRRIEQFIHEQDPALPDPVMTWETKLRDPLSDITRWERQYEWNYHAIVLLFWSIGNASIGVGAYRAIWGVKPLENTHAVVAVACAVLGAMFVVLFLILQQLATVCETEGPLRILRRREQAIARGTAKTAQESKQQ